MGIFHSADSKWKDKPAAAQTIAKYPGPHSKEEYDHSIETIMTTDGWLSHCQCHHHPRTAQC